MVTAFFRQLPRCPVVVVTLGLVEAWFDARLGLYLNTAPPAAAVASEPGRFRLDVLDHAEVLAALERMWALILEHGHPKVRMLITVSPVPLRATYTDQDVLVANSYSKSVLRAAVGAFAAADRRVDYFPSYEAATLTSRTTGFLEDNRHVAPHLVGAIMDSVMQSYVRADEKTPPPVEEPGAAYRSVAGEVRNHLKLGRPASARKLLAAVAKSGDFASAGYEEFQFRYVHARVLADLDAVLEAEIELRRALALQPQSAMASYALARLLLRLQRPLAAEEAFRQVVASEPANVDARIRLARMEARNGKLPDAERTGLAAQALCPDSVEVAELLAEVRAAAGAEWRDDDVDVAAASLQDGSVPGEEHPGRGTIAAQVGDHLASGRAGAAMKLLGRVAKSGDFTTAGYDEFEFRYVHARALIETGAPARAEQELRRCVAIEPRSTLAYGALGRVLGQLQRHAAAEDALRRVAALEPSSVEARLRLARAEWRNGNTDEAEQTLAAALALSPGHPEVVRLETEIRDARANGTVPSGTTVPVSSAGPRRAGIGHWMRGLAGALGARASS